MAHSIEQDIRGFIVEALLFGRDTDNLGRADSLLTRGIIDSTGVLELVSFVEREYDILVDDAELVPANFDSIERLAAYVERKRSQAPDEAVEEIVSRVA
ncbi:MAG: acyl carrier protein [Deltaproteobacteria bacterium]|nr:acyl carrier protein [Deltaproteobacteria bacterium]